MPERSMSVIFCHLSLPPRTSKNNTAHGAHSTSQSENSPSLSIAADHHEKFVKNRKIDSNSKQKSHFHDELTSTFMIRRRDTMVSE